MDATASLFSKAQYDAPKEDIALGIIVMVLQTIGSAAIPSALNTGIKDFVLIGNLTLLPQCKEIYPMLENFYNVRFHIPKYSEFCTAIGAALYYVQSKNK
jgi:type II pantothenate kinase